jgi:pheganomycin biosynthesis PGM1-like protein
LPSSRPPAGAKPYLREDHFSGGRPEFGKLGVVCVGATAERADELYRETVAVLDRESGEEESG